MPPCDARVQRTIFLHLSVGAVNPERLAEFIDRYRSFDDPDIPSFMYGSHYSTAVGVVLHYLVRLQPFAELHREMQVFVCVCVCVTIIVLLLYIIYDVCARYGNKQACKYVSFVF